jgi:hypothetical protein
VVIQWLEVGHPALGHMVLIDMFLYRSDNFTCHHGLSLCKHIFHSLKCLLSGVHCDKAQEVREL